MSLHQLQMALLVPDDNLKCFLLIIKKSLNQPEETFFIRYKCCHLVSSLHLIEPHSILVSILVKTSLNEIIHRKCLHFVLFCLLQNENFSIFLYQVLAKECSQGRCLVQICTDATFANVAIISQSRSVRLNSISHFDCLGLPTSNSDGHSAEWLCSHTHHCSISIQ